MIIMRHAGRRAGADDFDVTALAAAYPLGAQQQRAAVAPAARASARRLTGSLHEPNAWTVGILLATGVVLIARHPIARMLGTEVDTSVDTPVATAPAHPSAPSLAAPGVASVVAAVPTHAPRDPFRVLVSAGGKVLAAAPLATASKPAPVTAAPAVTTTPTTPPVSPAATSSCTGTVHHVASGESLWTIAARAVGSNDSARVTIAWHRLYAANRDSVGTDPSLVPVGASLCVPASL